MISINESLFGTATKVKSIGAGKALYQLDPPNWGQEFVVVSAIEAAVCGPNEGRPETYIFGANAKGTTTSLMEMVGSFRGEMNHEKALNLAGYALVEVPS